MATGGRPVVGRFSARWQNFPFPSSPHCDHDVAFGLWVPRSPAERPMDELAQDKLHSSDQDAPYFSIIWPSAEVLAAKVLAGRELAGRRVLDVGCGLGPCGFAAACRSARVTFLDREPGAIEIVTASAREQAIAASLFECVVADWRDPPSLPRFDLILGSDVLYEERCVSPLAAFLAAHLELDAEAWIADPGRPCVALFLDTLHEHGLEMRGAEVVTTPCHEESGIILIRLGRRPITSPLAMAG